MNIVRFGSKEFIFLFASLIRFRLISFNFTAAKAFLSLLVNNVVEVDEFGAPSIGGGGGRDAMVMVFIIIFTTRYIACLLVVRAQIFLFYLIFK